MVTKYSLLVDLMFCLLIQVNGTFIEAECEKLSGEGLLALKVCSIANTVKILKFGTPQTIAIIVLKIEKFDVTLH